MNKKTAIITGGSGGIGSACVKDFAENGYNVVMTYFSSPDTADAIQAQLGSRSIDIICQKCDVSSFNDCKQVVECAISAYGSVDILINCAGIAQQKMICDITDDDWSAMFDVNVKGVFNMTKAVLPHMVHKKQGKIINVSSIWGMVGGSCETHYSAAKAAVIGFTKAAAKELGPSGICVNCVTPGVIDTKMNAQFTSDDLKALMDETPLGRLGYPSEISSLALFLASHDSDFITGQVISPNGGFVI